jgi:hypothetical protein
MNQIFSMWFTVLIVKHLLYTCLELQQSLTYIKLLQQRLPVGNDTFVDNYFLSKMTKFVLKSFPTQNTHSHAHIRWSTELIFFSNRILNKSLTDKVAAFYAFLSSLVFVVDIASLATIGFTSSFKTNLSAIKRTFNLWSSGKIWNQRVCFIRQLNNYLIFCHSVHWVIKKVTIVSFWNLKFNF